MAHNATRKILLAVSGMSPQIVTETLYALVTREEQPWIPDEIHLLSTQEGCVRARNELLHESRDMFGKFCREYVPQGHVIKFDDSCLHAFHRDGEALNDIRDLGDSAVVADAIAAKVWALTQDENTEIHASIAGGRKSMGFLLGYAMSLYGRPQDRLSHVLVNDGFESSNDFYFKPRKSTIIHDRNGKPLDTAHAVISLAQIPILHLRGKLPKAMQKHPVSFAALVTALNASMNEPKIVFNPATQSLECHGVEVEMSPVNYAFYRYVAQKSQDEGLVDLMDITEADFLAIKFYGRDRWYQEDHRQEAATQFADKQSLKTFINDRKNEIKNALDERLGLIGLQQYAIKTRRGKSYVEIDTIEIN